MRRLALLLTVLALGHAPAAADEVGSVSYVEGMPEIVREGRVLHQEVDFGFRVENFDWIETDERSALEIAFDPQTGIDASVSVDADTQFHIDLSGLASEQTGAIDLVAGTVRVVARALSGGSRFQVRTSSASMGVRGTTFAVSGGPAGEILVTAEEGLVEVSDPSGRSLFASPGEAVEVDEIAARFRTVRYEQESLAGFRARWREQRLEELARRAPEILRFLGRRYRSSRERFVDAYRELMRRRAVIDRWIDQSGRGARPPATAREEARELAATLLRVRATMMRFETAHAQLVRILPVVRDLVAEVEPVPGFTASDLYEQLAAERDVMRERFAHVRHVLKLYARRSGGRTPFEFFERLQDTQDDAAPGR